MSVEIRINNSDDPASDYVGWAPCQCELRGLAGAPSRVVLRNQNPAQGGQVVFGTIPDRPPEDSIELDVPANGDPALFFVAGRFDTATGQGSASVEDKDTVIAAVDPATGDEVATKELMVRVRKNANDLTDDERDRFLSALVTLNQSGDFVEYQNMHTQDTSQEIHTRSCFLPWHRAYLLDLERSLQAIDPSVSLPYWKFDAAAPDVFNLDFIGLPDATGLVRFSVTNPLRNWRLAIFGQGTGQGVRREHRFGFDPASAPAVLVQNDENATLAFGDMFSAFATIESDPHGSAHVSFIGQISDIGRAPADPLFFLLHCNVDRLWAKWQWFIGSQSGHRLFEPSDPDAYDRQGTGDPSSTGANGIGNFTDDTMWPWNGATGFPRPNVAPGGAFPTSPLVPTPGDQPVVGAAIDFLGQEQAGRGLGFCYDDVPFVFPPQPPIV